MTPELYVVIGLVALAIWINRARLQGLAPAVPVARSPDPITVRYLEPQQPVQLALPPPQQAVNALAQMLALVHQETEKQAMDHLAVQTADTLTKATAASKATSPLWVGLSPPNQVPVPGPPKS